MTLKLITTESLKYRDMVTRHKVILPEGAYLVKDNINDFEYNPEKKTFEDPPWEVYTEDWQQRYVVPPAMIEKWLNQGKLRISPF